MEVHPRQEEGGRRLCPEDSTQHILNEVGPCYDRFLGTTVGVCDVSLIYVGRANVAVHVALTLLASKLYSEEHGSITAELITRMSYDHPVFGRDNAKVFKLR